VTTLLDRAVTLLAALAPVLGGAAAAMWLPRKRGRLFRVLGGFVASSSSVIVLIIVLGSAGALTRDALAVALAALSAASLWVLSFRTVGSGSPVEPDENDPADRDVPLLDVPPAGMTSPLSPKKNGFPAGAFLPGPAEFRETRDLPASPLAFTERVKTFTVVFVGLLALQVLALVAYAGWRHPPLAYDALMYHLVFPAEWIRQRQLVLVPTVFTAPANSYFPCNAEATFAYLMLAAGGERLVNLAQMPFLMAGAAALAGIARRCGLGWRACALAGCVFAVMPEAASQAGSALVDVDFASGVLLAIFFTLEFAATGSRAAVALAGASLGLVAGTKSLGLVFAAILGLLVALAARMSRSTRRSAIAADLGIAAVCSLPLGAFWYVRNWGITGNPLFPLDLTLGKMAIFRGVHGQTEMFQSHFHVPPAGAVLNVLARLWGPSHDLSGFLGLRVQVPALLLLLAIALGFGVRRLLARSGERLLIGALLVLPALMLAVFAVVNPYNTQYRFLLAAVGLSLLPLAAASEMAGVGGAVFSLACGAVVVDLLAQWGRQDPRMEVFRFPWLLMIAIAAPGAAPVFILHDRNILSRIRRAAGIVMRPLTVTLAISLALAVSVLAAYQPLVRLSYSANAGASIDGQRARVWQFVRDLPGRRVVAYTGLNQPYPFYGPELSNAVHYVAVDGRQNFNLHEYWRILGPESGLQPRRSYKPAYERQQPSRQKWLEGIEALGVDTLVVSRFSRWDREEYSHDPDGFPWENGWARSLPERFRLVLRTADLRVYEVIKVRN
jgi:hypothetical protein